MERPYLGLVNNLLVAGCIEQFSRCNALKGADSRWLHASCFQLDLDPILRSTVVFWHTLRFLCDDPVAAHLMAPTTGLPAQSVGLCRGNPDVVFVGVALLF